MQPEYDLALVAAINAKCNESLLTPQKVFKLIERFGGMLDDNIIINDETPYWQLLIWSHYILQHYMQEHETEEESDILMDMDPSDDLTKEASLSPLTRATWRENIIKGIRIIKRHKELDDEIRGQPEYPWH